LAFEIPRNRPQTGAVHEVKDITLKAQSNPLVADDFDIFRRWLPVPGRFRSQVAA
jgi:hypothetical protein